MMDSIVERIHHNVQVTSADIDMLVMETDQEFQTHRLDQINELFHVALEYYSLNAIEAILYYPCAYSIELTVPKHVIDMYLSRDTTEGIEILTYLAYHYKRRKSWVRFMMTGRQVENMLQRQVYDVKIQEFLDVYLQCRDSCDHLFTRMDWNSEYTTGLESINTEYIDYMAPGYRACYYDEYHPISSTIFEYWDHLKHYISGSPSVNHLLFCMVNEGHLSLVVDYTQGHVLDSTSMCMFLHVQLQELIFDVEAFLSEPIEWTSSWFNSLWYRSLCLMYLYDTQYEHEDFMEPFSSEVHDSMSRLETYFGNLCSISKFLDVINK